MTKQDGGKWTEKVTVLGAGDMERVLRRIAVEIVERNKGLDRVILLGIQRRGVHLAARIRELFKEEEKVKVPSGELDITLYRDDISVLADQPVVHSTSVPGDITGKRVILVDDVLFTGRTVRAALDAITDLGRPRGCSWRCSSTGAQGASHRRRLCGQVIPTSRSENVEVRVRNLTARTRW